MSNYYEINFTGMTPFVSMGCHGPYSSASFESDGVSVSIFVRSQHSEPIRVAIDIFSSEGGNLTFVTDTVAITSVEFDERISTKINGFLAHNRLGSMVAATSQLLVKPNSGFDTEISVPRAAQAFDIQLPNALVNGKLVNFPVAHFKLATKFYVGFCEA